VRDMCAEFPPVSHWAYSVRFAYNYNPGCKMIWRNLKGWVKLHFERKALGGDTDAAGKHIKDKVIAQAFNMSWNMQIIDPEVSWQVVNAALEVWKVTVSDMSPGFWEGEGV
jgi:hypothetical protein